MPARIELGDEGLHALAELASSLAGEASPQPEAFPSQATREVVAAYYTILYSIDYGLTVDERKRLGEALWRVIESGHLRYEDLASSGKGVEGLLEHVGFKLPGSKDRILLLKDLAWKVERLYGGSYYAVILESRGQLLHGGLGFIERVQDFTAYRSPARSKAYRLAAKLYEAGVLQAHDLWNAGVIVDSRLLGLAIRSRLLSLSEDLLERIAYGAPLDYETDRAMREYAYAAYRQVSVEAGLDPFTLDRALRIVYSRYCDYYGNHPRGGLGTPRCPGSREPRVWVRDPQPPSGSWWD